MDAELKSRVFTAEVNSGLSKGDRLVASSYFYYIVKILTHLFKHARSYGRGICKFNLKRT